MNTTSRTRPAELLLDQLDFRRAALSTLEPPGLELATSLSLRIPIAHSQRTFHFPIPFFFREIKASQLSTHWGVLCALARKHGVAVYSPVEAMESVPAVAVPARLARRFVNEPFNWQELTTADMFELEMRERVFNDWGWSSEIGSGLLSACVAAIRTASGGDIAVGVSLPLGCTAADFSHCLEADIDFLTLVATESELHPEHIRGVSRCRQLCQQLGKADFPLLVCAPLTEHQHLLKLLCLGASAVALDSWLLPLIPKPAATSTDTRGSLGMLSGIPMARTAPALPAVDQSLVQLKFDIERLLRKVGKCSVAELDAHCLIGDITTCG
jgi:hypothetical protein